MDNLAWGINLAVIGFFLACVPCLPKQRTWARSLVVFVTLLMWARYLAWRMTATAPAELRSWGGAFFFCALAIEILIFVNMALSLVILCRHADRSSEADRHEKWLRTSARAPAVRGRLSHHVQRGPRVHRAGNRHGKGPRLSPLQSLGAGRRPARLAPRSCAERGVGYIRRADNKHAKAGNINNALKVTQGELFTVFDADFTPHRNFLYRTVGFFFSDPRIVVVQTPQHFYNPDVFQVNLGLANVMQDNEREWYDVILVSRDAWDRAFCCGTSAVLRRDAVERVGGIATESVTEDILTTMKMLPDGYITRYLNERLSLGLAPEDVKGLMIQRRRWAQGIDSIDVPDVPPIRREIVVSRLGVFLSASLPLGLSLPGSVHRAAAGLFMDRDDPFLRPFDGGVDCLSRAADPGLVFP